MTERDTSGYRKIDLPDAERPVGYRQDYGSRPNQGPASAEKVAGKIVIPEAKDAYHGFRVVSRVVEGLYWRIEYEAPNGDRHTVRKLKSTREGHG
jgi:hypothetical protein